MSVWLFAKFTVWFVAILGKNPRWSKWLAHCECNWQKKIIAGLNITPNLWVKAMKKRYRSLKNGPQRGEFLHSEILKLLESLTKIFLVLNYICQIFYVYPNVIFNRKRTSKLHIKFMCQCCSWKFYTDFYWLWYWKENMGSVAAEHSEISHFMRLLWLLW